MGGKISPGSGGGKRGGQIASQKQSVDGGTVWPGIIAGPAADRLETETGIEGPAGGVVLGHLQKQSTPASGNDPCGRLLDEARRDARASRRRSDRQCQDLGFISGDLNEHKSIPFDLEGDAGLIQKFGEGPRCPGAVESLGVNGCQTSRQL